MYTCSRYATFTTTQRVYICFNCGGNSKRKVESLIIILPSSSLASLRTSSFGKLTRLLCSYLTDTWINNLGTSWGSVWSSNITMRQSLEMGGWTTWGWRVIHEYRLRLICSLIFEFSFFFGPKAITYFHGFSSGFFCNKTTFYCFRFNIQYVCE